MELGNTHFYKENWNCEGEEDVTRLLILQTAVYKEYFLPGKLTQDSIRTPLLPTKLGHL